MNVPINIPVPQHQSDVSGYKISAVPTDQPGVEPQGYVATSSYLHVEVSADGSNHFYPGEGIFVAALVFTYTENEVSTGTANDWFYITIPYTDTVVKIDLVEKYDDPEYLGITMVIWTKEMGDKPFYELLIVPIESAEIQ